MGNVTLGILLSFRAPRTGWHFWLCWTFTDYIVEKRIESGWSNLFLSSEWTVMSWWGDMKGLNWERCGHTGGFQWGGAWRAWTVEEYWDLEEGSTQNQVQGEKGRGCYGGPASFVAHLCLGLTGPTKEKSISMAGTEQWTHLRMWGPGVG